MKRIRILSVNISKEKGTIKTVVPHITLNGNGVDGDAHSGPWNRQVSLLGVESIRKFEKEANRSIKFGEFAENITTEGLELWKCHPLDRFIGDEAELEVTQIGKECHGSSCTIFREVGNCVMPKEGIFARVITPGTLKPGAELIYHPKIITAHVITLSDRAFKGEYEDLSGPRIHELLKSSVFNFQFSIFNSIIPDEPTQFRNLLFWSFDQKFDLVFTTGGTGIGPRDITPEVVRPMLDKEIPGIMELIRVKYGMEKPNALLSRSIAGVKDKTLIFTLPGSIKAVNEYMEEIGKSLIHMIYMLYGIDSH
jgi:molybdenum cofactor synthesis domain-containing protein